MTAYLDGRWYLLPSEDRPHPETGDRWYLLTSEERPHPETGGRCTYCLLKKDLILVQVIEVEEICHFGLIMKNNNSLKKQVITIFLYY